MCTAVTYQTRDHYFGRNLDLECSYQESVTVTPRNFPLPFRHLPTLSTHHAMIGMAYVVDGYPLYYDATNEKGLSMAGLSFPDNAHYFPVQPGRDNVASFEFIPWILGRCACVSQAEELLGRIHLTDTPFSQTLPPTPLHWIIADRERSLVVESVREGLQVYEDPIGVLTNNPPFDFQLFHLSNFLNLTNHPPVNRFSSKLALRPHSRGMGAMGLPGDLSSPSRFVRAAFTKLNSRSGESESESVSQFFHILGSVAQQRGCVHLGEGNYEITVYSSCCNVDKGIYYYTTYENSQITGVDMGREDPDGRFLISYPLVHGQQIRMENAPPPTPFFDPVMNGFS